MEDWTLPGQGRELMSLVVFFAFVAAMAIVNAYKARSK